jgi:hypothetical protein
MAWTGAGVLLLGLAATGAQAQAAQQTPPAAPVVVELFTSQGCSACPPADAFLADLAGRDDVIALALHVDYWDYIGWQDTFGDPAHSRRQKAYAHAEGRRTVFTPQMIVHGQDDVAGTKPETVRGLIAARAGHAAQVILRLEKDGANRLTIRARTGPDAPAGKALVQLVQYRQSQTVQITRGENAGRKITYRNIVTDWSVLGEWDMRAPFEASAEIGEGRRAAVIVQRPGPGAILAARRLR